MQSNNQRFSLERKTVMLAFLIALLCSVSPHVWAQAQAIPGFAQACQNVDGFMQSVVTLLGAISVGVVTVAIIFAGYQIAFAHKRLSDVAPILIGGLLIGGAATIATWFVGRTVSSC